MLNHYSQIIKWHEYLGQFMETVNLNIHLQTPFFWWLYDHRIEDIDTKILADQFIKFYASLDEETLKRVANCQECAKEHGMFAGGSNELEEFEVENLQGD